MRTHNFFYMKDTLCNETGTTSKHYLRAHGLVLGESGSNLAAFQLLQCDLATTVLGLSTTPAKYRYTPYGFRETNAQISELGLAGQHLDKLSGCYPLGNGHRFYSPVLKRFIRADTLSPFSDGGINPYTYCQNDPINHHDPSGRLRQWLRRNVSRLNRWLSPETPPPSRRGSLNTDTMLEIEPNELREVTVGLTQWLASDVANRLRPVNNALRVIKDQWNRLPEPVQEVVTAAALIALAPPVATTALAAIRTSTFLPVTPVGFVRILVNGPTDVERAALGLRRDSL